jgi:hypothetical protein
MGVLAIVAGAVGAVPISRLAIGREVSRKLAIEELGARRRRVGELDVVRKHRKSSLGGLTAQAPLRSWT